MQAHLWRSISAALREAYINAVHLLLAGTVYALILYCVSHNLQNVSALCWQKAGNIFSNALLAASSTLWTSFLSSGGMSTRRMLLLPCALRQESCSGPSSGHCSHICWHPPCCTRVPKLQQTCPQGRLAWARLRCPASTAGSPCRRGGSRGA